MAIYRTQITIDDPNRVVLSDLPFQPGDRVEIVIEKEVSPRTALGRQWAELLGRIDGIPRPRPISDDEIAAEIAAYRAGR
jgi:hypothetical protein